MLYFFFIRDEIGTFYQINASPMWNYDPRSDYMLSNGNEILNILALVSECI